MISMGVVLILLGVIIAVRQVLKNDEDICQIPLWVLMSALIMWGLGALFSTTYVVTRAYFVVLIISLIFSIYYFLQTHQYQRTIANTSTGATDTTHEYAA